MVMPFIDSSFEYESQLASAMAIVKPLINPLKCAVHNKKARLNFFYDESGIHTEICHPCCDEFAQIVKAALEDTELFNNIYIVNND